MTELSTQKPLITEVFIDGASDGARRGWDLATKSMLPNLVMAFVLIKVLTVSGLLNYIGMAFEPIMSIFGLPGESAMILVSAWMSSGGAIGVLLAFLSDGVVMNGEQAAIILPSIFIMGGQLQYMGRCLGVIGIKDHMLYVIMLIPIVLAFATLAVMSVLI